MFRNQQSSTAVLPVLGWLFVIGCAAYTLSGQPGSPLTAIGFILGLGGLWWANRRRSNHLDQLLLSMYPMARSWPVHAKTFPAYKLVDLDAAATWLAEQQPNTLTLASEHHEPLSFLLVHSGRFERPIRPPSKIARLSGPDSEVFVPVDSFRVLRSARDGSGQRAIMRLKYYHTSTMVTVEIAAPHEQDAIRLMEQLLERAASQTIFRNHLLRITFGHQTRDAYDDEDSVAAIDIAFLREAPVTDADIVLEDELSGILDHAIVDFHHRRAELMQLGVPGRRGVLFYGPPGTGKTYTCRYLSQRLAPITTIVASGHALLRMQDICALAAMLQPALVLLEDVDLVFASRELNPFNTTLGEFMDQLDGFGAQHEVIFLLTTNALERVEAAIKDRPGRVSQCIYFGPPSAKLRQRYLARALKPYTFNGDLGHIVRQTEGVSQAFLKELVYRAVQLASLEQRERVNGLLIDVAHLEAALHELLQGGGEAGRSIIGFRVTT